MIREAGQKDIVVIYHLICILEEQRLDKNAFAEVYMELLKDKKHHFFIFEEDGTIYGFLHMREEKQLHHISNVAEILELVVNPSMRSAGIGKKLLTYACEVAKDLGCTQIEVASNQLRKKAHEFYEREGMKNYHYKLSMKLDGSVMGENVVGGV